VFCASCREQADTLVERVLGVAALRECVVEGLPWCRSIRPLPKAGGVAGALVL